MKADLRTASGKAVPHKSGSVFAMISVGAVACLPFHFLMSWAGWPLGIRVAVGVIPACSREGTR